MVRLNLTWLECNTVDPSTPSFKIFKETCILDELLQSYEYCWVQFQCLYLGIFPHDFLVLQVFDCNFDCFGRKGWSLCCQDLLILSVVYYDHRHWKWVLNIELTGPQIALCLFAHFQILQSLDKLKLIVELLFQRLLQFYCVCTIFHSFTYPSELMNRVLDDNLLAVLI